MASLQSPIAVGPRGHDRRHLNPPTLAAYLTAHSERQATIPGTRSHHRGEVKHRPASAARAIGPQLAAVLVEAGDAAWKDCCSKIGDCPARGVRASPRPDEAERSVGSSVVRSHAGRARYVSNIGPADRAGLVSDHAAGPARGNHVFTAQSGVWPYRADGADEIKYRYRQRGRRAEGRFCRSKGVADSVEMAGCGRASNEVK